MKKVSATVIYKGNRIYNLTVNHKGSNVTLLQYDLYAGVTPYQYSSFKEVYETVLRFLKNNNFYCGSYEDFGRIWYDISWIDLEYPTEISKHGLPK